MIRITLALGVALAALVATTPVSARPATAKATIVNVTMKDFKFVLSKKSVRHGLVTFKLVNKGKVPHDFSIGGKKSKLLKPGKSGTLTVSLQGGKRPYKCTVPGHATLGMKGTLTVT